MVHWSLASNLGYKSVHFEGKSSPEGGWVGILSLAGASHTADSEGEFGIWDLSMKQFSFSVEAISCLRDGFLAWREGGYLAGFTVPFSSCYYHEFAFELEPTEPMTGKALFKVSGSFWGLSATFRMTTDQSCVLKTIEQLNAILKT